MIYLASPYSHDSETVRKLRYIAACEAAAWLLCQPGCGVVYSPIAHSHGLVVHGGLGGSWSEWADMDTHFLLLARRLVVLGIDGWRDSVGVRAEMAAWKDWGRPEPCYVAWRSCEWELINQEEFCRWERARAD